MPPQIENNFPQNPPEDTRQGKRSYKFLMILTILSIVTGIFGVWFFFGLHSQSDSGWYQSLLQLSPQECTLAGGTIFNTLTDNSYDKSSVLGKVTDMDCPCICLKSQKDESADWKTYRNEEYGFELKYPNDWIINTTSSEKNFTRRGVDQELMGGDTFWENYNWNPEEPGNEPADHHSLYLIVYRTENKKDPGIQNFFYENYGYKNAPQDIKLNNIFVTNNGTRGEYFETKNSDHPIGLKTTITIFNRESDFYVFKSPFQSKTFHNQILSTFKFTQ